MSPRGNEKLDCRAFRRRDLDERIAQLAARQHGVVLGRQLEELGMTMRAAQHWARAGRLQRIHRGVYAVGWRQPRIEQRFLAAVLACGEGAVLSHRSAAVLWGLVRSREGPVDVLIRGRRPRSRGGICTHRSDELDDDELTRRSGIPVTSAARTLIDVAPQLSRRELVRTINDALVERLTTEREILSLVARRSRRRGAHAVADVLVEAAGRTRSVLEDLALELIARHRLPQPRVNARIRADGVSLEVDLLWPPQRLVVELDGGRYHDPVTARARDAERMRALREAGYRVMRLTWSDVVHDARATAERLRAELGGAAEG